MREGERNSFDAGDNQRVEDGWIVQEVGAGRVFPVGQERCDGIVKSSTETAEGKQGGALCVCIPAVCV